MCLPSSWTISEYEVTKTDILDGQKNELLALKSQIDEFKTIGDAVF